MVAAGFAVGFIVVDSLPFQAVLLAAVVMCLYRAGPLGGQLARHCEDQRTVLHFFITALFTIALFAALLLTYS